MKTQKELKELYKLLLTVRNPDYYLKEVSHIVELSDGSLFPIEKPHLQTSFCFGWGTFEGDEEANKMVNHAQNSQEYFRSANLENFDRDPKSIAKHTFKVCNSYRGENIKVIHPLMDWENPANHTLLSEEDRVRILEGYKIVRARFEKRINTYLKRYGTSKLRTWSYWADA